MKDFMRIALKGSRRANGKGLSMTHREEHLRNVAELAKKFAETFGSGDWAYLAGLWHDFGVLNVCTYF